MPAPETPEAQVIEVIEEVLSAPLFTAAIVGGVIVGGIAVYLFLATKGVNPLIKPRAVVDDVPAPLHAIEYVDEGEAIDG